ncbi:MAG TPA: DUF2690 domain-containing protein [Streptosporangiaceae bacterium]
MRKGHPRPGWHRLGRAAAAAGLAAAVITTGTPASAAMATASAGAAGLTAAVSCSGYGCDGQNPYGSGCFTGSKVIDDVLLTSPGGTSYGPRVRLWYSPACHTVWASMYDAPYEGAEGPGDADIHRNSDNSRYDCSVPLNDSSCYTNMLYDGGVTSHAHATDYSSKFGTIQATTSDY